MANVTEIKAYGDVQVGDEIYNAKSYVPGGSWLPVSRVKRLGDYVGLVTSVYTQWGHAREGVYARRREQTRSSGADLLGEPCSTCGHPVPEGEECQRNDDGTLPAPRFPVMEAEAVSSDTIVVRVDGDERVVIVIDAQGKLAVTLAS